MISPDDFEQLKQNLFSHNKKKEDGPLEGSGAEENESEEEEDNSEASSPEDTYDVGGFSVHVSANDPNVQGKVYVSSMW